MGFFTDAYDLFSISLVTKLLGRIYYTDTTKEKPGTLPPSVSSSVTDVALVGTLIGQLFFGWLGDKMGRKKVYGVTLILMIVCSLASAFPSGRVPKRHGDPVLLRFWLGFASGRLPPLCHDHVRGFGILTSGIVALISSVAFDHAYGAPSYEDNPAASTVPQADYIWRIILMFGALPAALTFYWRMKMPETARYTALVARNAKQAAQDMAKVLNVELEAEEEKLEKISEKPANNFGLFSKQFLRRHGLHLLGTTTTWFLLDIAFYSNNLFQKDIFSAIGWIPPAKTMNAVHEVYRIAKAQTLIALCSTVPGYWFTVLFIDIIGRFAIQLMGFFFMTVFMFALAIPSTCHGISAAAGKAGAIVGAFGFLYAAQPKDPSKRDAGYPAGIGIKYSLIVLGCVNALGLVFTFLVPEPKGKSLEEMSGENEDDEVTTEMSHRTAPV
ncbi:hypothetical protein DH2020_019811 [Rehmannia glutinosa]|uniref:Major facilitator superfamily (MFS) profile domain-containing protein n=1 Tax=Rehmannia glutinosa TaxID=99300 RepID=A0ABR0WET9_REHGL